MRVHPQCWELPRRPAKTFTLNRAAKGKKKSTWPPGLPRAEGGREKAFMRAREAHSRRGQLNNGVRHMSTMFDRESITYYSTQAFPHCNGKSLDAALASYPGHYNSQYVMMM